jgi:hypothetical protein
MQHGKWVGKMRNSKLCRIPMRRCVLLTYIYIYIYLREVRKSRVATRGICGMTGEQATQTHSARVTRADCSTKEDKAIRQRVSEKG